MYASDIINRNRAATLYINSVLKKREFESGLSIRIDRQKGGNDYEYLKNVEFGGITNTTYDTYSPLSIIRGSNPVIFTTYNLNELSYSGVTEYGTALRDSSNNRITLDDGSVRIPTAGDFFFFGINYAAANNIYWNSNNALTFGTISDNTVSFSRNKIPAILIGNYDRLISKIYSSSYFSQGNLFSVTVILVYFSNYYTDTTNLEQGKYQIRLIRELNGNKRQWVEVTVISEVASPGYSNNPAVTYPSGTDTSGNPIDANGQRIDSTKNSPYDITDGTNFQNVMGSLYSTVSPQPGTTLLYQSDSNGYNWNFTNNAYIPV
jgi:hypothetical protein